MKTAIIGLPMTGKTSLFAILTGVAQESRIGSTAVRTGVAKVPDPRVDLGRSWPKAAAASPMATRIRMLSSIAPQIFRKKLHVPNPVLR